MRPKTKLTDNGTWKIALVMLGVCLLFGPALAAQDRDAYGSVPETLTLPVGTTVAGELSQYLSSHQNHPGDQFTMTLTQPLIVNGWVVARVGQVANGQVTVANKGGAGKGPSELGLELTELILVDGQQMPITTQLVESSGGSNTGRNVATVATTTGLGAVIGAAIGEGTGAGIGAATGAAAGMIAVLKTSGKPTVIPPESTLTFRLGAPVNISTERSERAFLPVSPQDYGTAAARTRYAPPPARPYVRPYPPYPYDYPYAYAYPYPYFVGPRITIVRPYRGFRGPSRGYRYGRR